MAVSLLTQIPASRLREFWPWVREGLERITEKSYTDWLPEDVYMALRGNAATLYVIGEDEAGFIILQQQGRSRGLVLFVWAIAGELRQHEQAVYAELDRIGREVGACAVEMQSSRDGWANRGYFEPRATIYVKELS